MVDVLDCEIDGSFGGGGSASFRIKGDQLKIIISIPFVRTIFSVWRHNTTHNNVKRHKSIDPPIN